MTELEFWMAFRRAMIDLVCAIEKRFDLEPRRKERSQDK